MGSKKSSSTSANTTNQYDQRSITTVDDRDTYNTSSYDLSDRSVSSYDLSDRSTSSIALSSDSSNRSQNSYGYSSDSSNRSTNTTNTSITTADPGAVRLGELNAQLLGAVAETQGDAVKTIAGLGAGAFRDAGAVYTSAFGANERAWSHTVDASEGVITRLLEGAKGTTDASKALATAAISAYQPADSKLGDAIKWAALGGVALVALAIFR